MYKVDVHYFHQQSNHTHRTVEYLLLFTVHIRSLLKYIAPCCLITSVYFLFQSSNTPITKDKIQVAKLFYFYYLCFLLFADDGILADVTVQAHDITLQLKHREIKREHKQDASAAVTIVFRFCQDQPVQSLVI